MKTFFLTMAIVFTWALQPEAFAQIVSQPQPTFSQGACDTWNFEWESIEGRTYFLQYSDDLQHWNYLPEIVTGDGMTISYGMASTSDKYFVRLLFTDEVTSDPENDDFDGDGLSNIDELLLYGTDPLNPMTDGVTPDAIAAIPGAWWNTTGCPEPTDAIPPAPIAYLLTRRIEVELAVFVYEGAEYQTKKTLSVYKNLSNLVSATYYDDEGVSPTYADVIAAEDFTEFSAAVSNLEFDGPDDSWIYGVKAFNTSYSNCPPVSAQFVQPQLPPRYYKSARQQYRLLLSDAAPKGGYTITLRIATPKRTIVSSGNLTTSAGSPPYIDLVMTVAEGQTTCDPVEVPITVIPINTQTVCLPADIQLYHGVYPPEIDGMCVTSGNGFIADFDGVYGDSKFNEWLPDATFEWQARRVMLDGNFEAWTALGPNGAPYHLPEQTVYVNNEGCYQLQLAVILPDTTKIEMPYTRRWNARSIIDSHGTIALSGQVGKPDYFGVANDSIAMDIRNRAKAWLGSTQYSVDAQMITNPNPPTGLWNPSTLGASKCNIFVNHVSNYVGNFTPYWVRHLIFCAAPLARQDWFTDPSANVDLNTYGWPFCATGRFPSPGMAISTDHGGTGTGSGHVGILDYDGSWINAGKKSVNKFIFLDDPSSGYIPVHLRADQ